MNANKIAAQDGCSVACYPETPVEQYDKTKLLNRVVTEIRNSSMAYGKKRPKSAMVRGFLMGKEIDIRKLTAKEIGCCVDIARAMKAAEFWAGQATHTAMYVGSTIPISVREHI